MSALHVLLVSYSFPPAGGVGVLRAASLARYLPAEGIRLDVLTASNASAVGSDPALLRAIPGEVTIHRTLAPDLPFALKKRIKAFLSPSKPKAQTGAITAPEPPNLLRRMIQDLLLPDPQVAWLPMLRREAGRIVRKRSIDLVLITVPPFSSVGLAESLRKQFPRLPIVLDFRDEWLTTAIDLFGFSQSQRARAVASRVEASAIKSATAVVAVSEAARREIRARYPHQPESKFSLVPNGFDATRPANIARKSGQQRNAKIVIAHVGTVYRTTDPTAVVAALQALPPAIAARFTLRFIGHIEEERFRAALLQLGDRVELTGFLPQREALALMEESDYALLISRDPLNIGAKFYDYVGSNKPILGILHPDGDLRRLLEELRAGWWAPYNDVPAIGQLFLDAAARGNAPFRQFSPATEKIAQYARKPLAQRYAHLLHSIAVPQSADSVTPPTPELAGRAG